MQEPLLTPTVNQDEINLLLWKAGETFRETTDPSQYKQ
jgi:hypothetical protein